MASKQLENTVGRALPHGCPPEGGRGCVDFKGQIALHPRPPYHTAGPQHPKVPKDNQLGELFAILGSVGRGPGVTGVQEAADELGIRGNFHGIRHGWFNWPYNFDPVWLDTCNGFEMRMEDR